MATFEFGSVEQGKLNLGRDRWGYGLTFNKLSDYTKSKDFIDKENDRVVLATDKQNTICPSLGNGLLGTIYRAYSKHIPLVLRPDDIWLAIVVAFGKYVTTHSEEMRQVFVEHEGRKELVINIGPNPPQTMEQWKTVINIMADMVKKNTSTKTANWIIPNFSTTTKNDITAANLVLMGTVKEYFAMRMELGCGLQKVTLEGTLDDWKKLRLKASALHNFGAKQLSDWADLLLPVLDQFIEAYTVSQDDNGGKVNEDFWQRICTSTRRGSGSQQTFRGWFLVFTPFDNDGKYMLRSKEQVDKDNIYAIINDDEIVDCGIDVPIVVGDSEQDENGFKYQMVFYTGVLMSEYDVEKNELRPSVGYSLIQKKEITFDDMHQRMIMKCAEWSRYRSDKSGGKLNPIQNDLINFGHHLAIQSHFPNDKLISFTDLIVHYYFNHTRELEGRRLDPGMMKGFVNYLGDRWAIYSGGHNFSKYIDPKQVKGIINDYVEKNLLVTC